MRIVGNLKGPTKHSRDILLQAKGITGIESTPIRWFSRWLGRGRCPVEHSSAEAKSLKLEAMGLSGCHPSGQQPRQPDRRARGQQRTTLTTVNERTQSLGQLWLEAQWGKRPKEERRLLYALILKLQKGMVSGLMKSVMCENQNNWSQVLATALRYLRFKLGKRGLNVSSPVLSGGGGRFSHIT